MTKKPCPYIRHSFFALIKDSRLFFDDLLAIIISASLADAMCKRVFTALRAFYHAGKVELPYT